MVWGREKEGERVAGREKSEADFLFLLKEKDNPLVSV